MTAKGEVTAKAVPQLIVILPILVGAMLLGIEVLFLWHSDTACQPEWKGGRDDAANHRLQQGSRQVVHRARKRLDGRRCVLHQPAFGASVDQVRSLRNRRDLAGLRPLDLLRHVWLGAMRNQLANDTFDAHAPEIRYPEMAQYGLFVVALGWLAVLVFERVLAGGELPIGEPNKRGSKED